MKPSLRNRLSDLKVIIIDKISMVSNDLLFYIHLRFNEILGSITQEPFPGLIVIAIGDFFSIATSRWQVCVFTLQKYFKKLLIQSANFLDFLS